MDIKKEYYFQEKRPEINITQTPQGVYIFNCVGGSSSYNVCVGQTTSHKILKEKISRFLRHEKKSPLIRSKLSTDELPPACSGMFKEEICHFD